MNKKQVEILLRRQTLLAKIADQRLQVSEFSQRCQRPAQLLDYAIAAGKEIKKRPAPFVGGLVALLVYRRGVFGLLKTSWKLWKLYRNGQKLKQHPAFKMALDYFKYKNR